MATFSNAMKSLRSSYRAAAVVGASALMACSIPTTIANAQSAPPSLQAGQCLPMAEMNAALRAEGQRTMIIGNRSAVQERDAAGNPTRVVENVETITSNADGSLGYNLGGDRPREEASTRVCVGAKLTNIRLYDARQASIPRDAYLGGTFNQLVDENAARGTRPMVVADTVFSNDNGGTRMGRPIVLFGNVEGRSGSLVTYTANQEPARLALLVSTDYTPAAMERINGGRTLAALSPTIAGGGSR
jgi:hypothetical protein